MISKATGPHWGSNKVKAIVDIANDFLGFSSQANKIQGVTLLFLDGHFGMVTLRL